MRRLVALLFWSALIWRLGIAHRAKGQGTKDGVLLQTDILDLLLPHDIRQYIPTLHHDIPTIGDERPDPRGFLLPKNNSDACAQNKSALGAGCSEHELHHREDGYGSSLMGKQEVDIESEDDPVSLDSIRINGWPQSLKDQWKLDKSEEPGSGTDLEDSSSLGSGRFPNQISTTLLGNLIGITLGMATVMIASIGTFKSLRIKSDTSPSAAEEESLQVGTNQNWYWGAVYAGSVLCLSISASTHTIVAAQGPLQAALKMDLIKYNLMVGARFAAGLVGSMLSPWLMKKYGAESAVKLAGGVFLLATLFQLIGVFGKLFVCLIIGAMFAEFTCGIVVVLISNLVGNVVPSQEQPRAMMVVQFFLMTGVAAPLIGIPMMLRYLHLKPVIVVSNIFTCTEGLLAAYAFHRLVRSQSWGKKASEDDAEGQEKDTDDNPFKCGSRIVSMLAVLTMVSSVTGTIRQNVIMLLVTSFDLRSREVTAIVSVCILGTAASGLAGNAITRFAGWRIPLLGGLMFLILALVQTSGGKGAVTCAILYGLGLSLALNATYASLARTVAVEHLQHVIALGGRSTYVGLIILPPLFGVLTQKSLHLGVSALIAILAISFIVVATICVLEIIPLLKGKRVQSK